MGTPSFRLNITESEMAVALQKFKRYFKERVIDTGSLSSIATDFSASSSIDPVGFKNTDPLPTSPVAENRTPSLLTAIETIKDEKREYKQGSYEIHS